MWFFAILRASRSVPPQFLIGASPLTMPIWLLTTLPHFLNSGTIIAPLMGKLMGSFPMITPIGPSSQPFSIPGKLAFLYMLPIFMESFLTACGSAQGICLEPASTTALSRLLPITAPTPQRAAMRPASLTIPEMSESFSPAGPMDTTRGSFFPVQSSTSFFSVSIASMPQ